VEQLRSVLDTIRAAGFGGLLLGGIGVFVYYRYFAQNASINPYVFIGAFAGVGIAIQEAFTKALSFTFGSVFRLIAFRRKLDELRELRRNGELTDAAYDELVKKVCEKRFIDK
jgi:hypothetical protein